MDAEIRDVKDIKIFGVDAEVAEALKEYAKLKAGGKFNVALERLISESSILSIFNVFADKIESLNERINTLEEKDTRTIRTLKGTIIGRK